MSYDLASMGRHTEWRKQAKKERRRRIRKTLAIERDKIWNISEDWLQEQEMFEYEQIEASNKVENDRWIQAEKIAMEQWQKLQEENLKLQLKRLEQEAKLRLEWELEQKKKKLEEDRLKQIEEENKKRQQDFMECLEKFLSGDSADPPKELLASRETRPNMAPCPFFSKTACCRFGDQCSRNHQYPSISKVLLATNFYAHFGLDNTHHNNEYDTDIMLEYDDSDTYKEFKEFFYDIIPEFEKFGKIVQLKVCNNYEKHLRGNTYIEFAELRCAVAAYRSLHTRWYGGRQLSLQFCIINSWKNAICGLQLRKRCPKGRACNFLHVFRNPDNRFSEYRSQSQDINRTRRTPPRSWRWSESPEVEIPKRNSKKSDKKHPEKKHADHRRRHRHSSHRRERR